MNHHQRKTSIHAIGIATLTTCVTASAATINYSFDGTFTDYFNPPTISPGFEADQESGQLVLHNDNSSAADLGAEATASTFAPRYDQSWSASIIATIPAAYAYVDGSECELDISVLFSSGSGGSTRNLQFTNTFNVGAAGGRHLIGYQHETDENDVEVDLDFSNPPIAVAGDTFTLELSYDAATTTLSASSPGLGTYYSADISSPSNPDHIDWGMTASDTFTLQIAGWTDNQAIPDTNPMVMDDYSANIVPEPSAMTLLGLGGLSLLIRRRKE